MRPSPDRLRAAREAAELSREQAAVAIHRSYHTIASYEVGRKTPPGDIIGQLALLYGCTVDCLYESVSRAA